MKKKSWRTSLVAVLCWTGAALSLHWQITHHPGRWFFNMGEFNNLLAPILLFIQGHGHWHAKDKKSQ